MSMKLRCPNCNTLLVQSIFNGITHSSCYECGYTEVSCSGHKESRLLEMLKSAGEDNEHDNSILD